MAAGHRACKPEKCWVNGFRRGLIWGPKGCPTSPHLALLKADSDPGPRAGPGQTELSRTSHMTRDMEPDQNNQRRHLRFCWLASKEEILLQQDMELAVRSWQQTEHRSGNAPLQG